MERQRLHILGVNAHPHDFTHYAGTLGIHKAMGDEVTVVTMTSGSNTHNEKLADELRKPPEERDPKIMEQSEEEYAALKIDELLRACARFDVTDVRDLGFPQPFSIDKYPDAIKALEAIILELRPDVMITQSPYLTGHDGRPEGTRDDHLETAYASIEARQAARIAVYGNTEPPHKVAATYFPGVYFEPNEHDFIVDVSAWFEQRVEAEATFVSQGHTPENSHRRIMLTTGVTGSPHGIQYAEAFVREKPEVLPHIVVANASLRAAGESYSEMTRRRLGKSG